MIAAKPGLWLLREGDFINRFGEILGKESGK
jgi:hypothetical protein